MLAALNGCAPGPAVQPEGFDRELALPRAQDLDPSPRVVEIALEARVERVEVRAGQQTELWTYNGTLPGPMIRARRGDRLVVHFTNRLPEATTIHWHGLRVPADQDGSAADQQPVPPGGTFEYSFYLPDSGTYWYHPHVNSSGQLGRGLYGALVVEEPDEPRGLGDDVVLLLSDMSLEDDGTLAPPDESGWFGDYFGREGSTLLVNGRIHPTLRARVGVPQRWRVINAARARYQQFEVPGQSLIRIGGDAGLIEHPTPVDVVTLAPGERAELYVVPRTQRGEPVTVQWTDTDRFNVGMGRPPAELFRYAVTDEQRAAPPPPLPARLRTIEPIDTTGATVRSLELTDARLDGEAVLGINGVPASVAPPMEARVHTTEIWDVRNATPYDHPFHLHGFFFQVIDVDGRSTGELEWRDTVNVRGNQRVRLAVTFDNRPGMWMFHCHILDHADLGMMGMLMLMDH